MVVNNKWSIKKTLCVITWYKSGNYGTCIQCYALVKYLKNMGYKVWIPESLDYYYGVRHPLETINFVIRKIKNKFFPTIENFKSRIRKKRISDYHKKNYEIRTRKNIEFSMRELDIYIMENKKAYLKLLEEVNVYITGSDQIWNPDYVVPPCLLSMVSNESLKIAYGSSIGVKHIPKYMKNMYRKYLNRFDAIGVREETAKSELNKLLTINVQSVLDPTFLLRKDEWLELTKKASYEIRNEVRPPYIFCYFIGENSEWQKHVNEYANINHLSVYTALSESYIIPTIGTTFAQAGVEDFIWLLMNAECVVTDSFHATALSINFQKKLVVYKRFKDYKRNSQNSRITDLLKQFCMSKCLVAKNDMYLTAFNQQIDYQKINHIIDKECQKSLQFLTDALSK